jgi:hypothetical protein
MPSFPRRTRQIRGLVEEATSEYLLSSEASSKQAKVGEFVNFFLYGATDQVTMAKAQMRDFYSERNPTKVDQVDQLIDCYRFHDCVESLATRYAGGPTGWQQQAVVYKEVAASVRKRLAMADTRIVLLALGLLDTLTRQCFDVGNRFFLESLTDRPVCLQLQTLWSRHNSQVGHDSMRINEHVLQWVYKWRRALVPPHHRHTSTGQSKVQIAAGAAMMKLKKKKRVGPGAKCVFHSLDDCYVELCKLGAASIMGGRWVFEQGAIDEDGAEVTGEGASAQNALAAMKFAAAEVAGGAPAPALGVDADDNEDEKSFGEEFGAGFGAVPQGGFGVGSGAGSGGGEVEAELMELDEADRAMILEARQRCEEMVVQSVQSYVQAHLQDVVAQASKSTNLYPVGEGAGQPSSVDPGSALDFVFQEGSFGIEFVDGARVKRVFGQAAELGMLRGDTITAIAGIPTDDAAEIVQVQESVVVGVGGVSRAGGQPNSGSARIGTAQAALKQLFVRAGQRRPCVVTIRRDAKSAGRTHSPATFAHFLRSEWPQDYALQQRSLAGDPRCRRSYVHWQQMFDDACTKAVASAGGVGQAGVGHVGVERQAVAQGAGKSLGPPPRILRQISDEGRGLFAEAVTPAPPNTHAALPAAPPRNATAFAGDLGDL